MCFGWLHCLPQRLRSTLVEGASGAKKKFQKTLILVFEVIVQPPKTHFLTFSKVQKHIMEKKSETKIMKITHSEMVGDSFLYQNLISTMQYFFIGGKLG